ncbi:unnamed protein product, partial [Mesorhabditis spiculigera]
MKNELRLFVIFACVFETVCQSVDIRCYSCTSMEAEQLLNDVTDPNWRRWLENVRNVPYTETCKDYFQVDRAIRSGVKNQNCEDGACMKMWFQEVNGASHVWRSCIPNARDQIRSDCTRVSTSQGEMEVCTCTGNLCNSSPQRSVYFISIFVLCALLSLML